MKTLLYNNLIAAAATTTEYPINDTFAIFSPTTITQNRPNPQNHSQRTSDWGPKRDPLYIIVPITVLYTITFFCGVLGNLSTCIVIARNRSMHTATNYYLFSLAVSDLLLLTSGLPPEIYSIWSKYPYIFGETFCILQGFAAETSANATVLTITAFTIERYVAICHPFLSHTLSKLSRAIRFIVAIWIVAMCLAIPQAIAFGVVCEEGQDGTPIADHCVCIVKRSVLPHAFEMSTFLFFVAPMTLITILYILIGLQLHRTAVGPSRGNSVKMKHRLYKTPSGTGGHQCNSYLSTQAAAVLVVNDGPIHNGDVKDEDGRKNFAKNAQATRHVVRMLIAVVVAFFICWAPFHAQRLLAIYGERSSARMIRAFQILTYVSGVLYYLSTTVNPVLYHIMSNKFREAFKSTYKQCFQRSHHIPVGRCYSTLSARSSQLNSHSNTDSYSRQCSLRYLDAEMARLHDSARPLVVSFRRKTAKSETGTHHRQYGTQRRPNKQVIVFDVEQQDTLDGRKRITEENCSFIEVHSLEPTHICPLLVNGNNGMEGIRKSGNIKSFDELQQLNYNKQGKLRSGST